MTSIPPLASRRIVFQGLGALGVACALAACGGGGGSSADGTTVGGASPEKGTELAKVSEVPVGGGVILTGANVVITQPVDGTFKGFLASCTHQGTQLNAIDGTDIVCPLHGSRFSIADGSVQRGPASSPLEDYPVAVQGDSIVAA